VPKGSYSSHRVSEERIYTKKSKKHEQVQPHGIWLSSWTMTVCHGNQYQTTHSLKYQFSLYITFQKFPLPKSPFKYLLTIISIQKLLLPKSQIKPRSPRSTKMQTAFLIPRGYSAPVCYTTTDPSTNNGAVMPIDAAKAPNKNLDDQGANGETCCLPTSSNIVSDQLYCADTWLNGNPYDAWIITQAPNMGSKCVAKGTPGGLCRRPHHEMHHSGRKECGWVAGHHRGRWLVC